MTARKREIDRGERERERRERDRKRLRQEGREK